jgi:PAS domain S-box-containing protein
MGVRANDRTGLSVLLDHWADAARPWTARIGERFGAAWRATCASARETAAPEFLRSGVERLAARLPHRRSLAVKILVVGIVFAVVPVIVYDRFDEADREKTTLLLKAAREQGRLIATYLEPTLRDGPSSLPRIEGALQPLSSENLNIRVLFRPSAAIGNSGFYYVGASPPQSIGYLKSELSKLIGLGVLAKLSSSCQRNQTVGIRHAVGHGPEQLITAITPVAVADGCWLILTSYSQAEFLESSSIGRPYWQAPEIQFASLLYFGAAVFIITVLLRIRRSLRAFRSTAIAIGRGQSDRSFAAQNPNPDLTDVAEEFDAMVRRIGLLSFSVERSPIAVAIADSAWQLEYTNPAYEALAGRSRDELLGHDLRETVFDSLSDESWDEICRRVTGGDTWQGELRTQSRRGRIRWTEVSLYCLAARQGGTERFVCIQEDVSERKQILQDLVAAKDRAESLNRMKSNFVARMSHEFRTPLNAILGFSEVISKQVLGPCSEPRYVEYAGHVHSSGTHLLSLINDVLDLSKLESGKETLDPEPIDLSVLIAEAVVLVTPDAEKAGVALGVDDRLDGRPVTGDRRALKQVLLNLLSNGVRYTPAGGRVAVTTEPHDGGIRLRVSDTGCGIEESDIPRLCEPYERAGTAYVRKTQGTGLGLPIVKRLVELHKGAFRIESALGEGTTVEIVLPADDNSPAAAA